MRHGHADQLHRQRQLRQIARRRRRVNVWRHGHADQLHRQRQRRRLGGGGVFNCYGPATVTLTNCTISGNSATGSGGGVYSGRKATYGVTPR